MVLSSTSGGVYITLFATVIDATVGITSASLNLVFLLVTELQKKDLKTMRKKKEKRNKFFYEQDVN